MRSRWRDHGRSHMGYLLGPGVHMALSGGLMFGPRFLQAAARSRHSARYTWLGLTVDALRRPLAIQRRLRFSARISRKTSGGGGALPAPIQQALGAPGLRSPSDSFVRA